MDCIICGNQANATNSHIIPMWVIDSMVASDNTGKSRNRELSFSIGGNFASTYIGREVSPEKIIDILGNEEISEYIIEENSNQFSRDNILCNSCEKKLGYLESEVASTFRNRINDFRSSNEKILALEDIDRFRLFIYSIIFRMSATKFSNYQLEKKFEDVLQKILNYELNSISHAEERAWFPMQILILQQHENDTMNIALMLPNCTSPYCFIFNYFVVFIYYKEKTVQNNPLNLIGLESEIEKSFLLDKNVINVKKLDLHIYKSITSKLYKLLAKKTTELLLYNFKGVYKNLFRIEPSQKIIDNFFKYFHDYNSLGKYTMKGFVLILKSYFDKLNQ